MEQDGGDGAQDDRQVGDEGPVVHVVQVELSVLVGFVVAIETSADLLHSGDSRLHPEAVA